MPVFRVRYAEGSGARRVKIVRADSRYDAAALVPGKDSVLLTVEELDTAAGEHGTGRASSPPAGFVLELTQTLALLYRSGLDVKEGLEIARTIYSKGKAGRTVEELAAGLERGDSFSGTAEYLSFPRIYSGLIKVGEKVGSLAQVLPGLADYLRTRKELKDKFINALLYPSVVLAAVIIGSLSLLIFVAPKMGEILAGLGQNPEQMLLITGRMRLFSILSGTIVGGGLSAGLTVVLLRRFSGYFRLASDRALLRLPLAGSLASLGDTVNLVFALEVLSSSGVSLEDALEQAAEVTENRAFSAGLRQAREKILRGERPSAAFESAKVFPPRLVRWLALGERTGRVEEVFTGLKTWYQGEYETFLTRVSSLAEPLLIILTGALLFTGVVVFVLPLLSGFGELF
jgi:type II secretory pathway component PulF